MDLENHTVTKSGKIVELTAKEFDILRLLLEHPQKVYTKAQLYSMVWMMPIWGMKMLLMSILAVCEIR